MTLGYVQREMNLLKERVKILEETKTYGDRTFRRLLTWTILAACCGVASVIAVYLK